MPGRLFELGELGLRFLTPRYSANVFAGAILLVALPMAAPALAQAPARSFQALSSFVSDGDSIVVKNLTGGEVKGSVVRLDAAAITISVQGQLVTLTQPEVYTVTRYRRPLGWLTVPIGAAAAFGICYAWPPQEGNPFTFALLIYAPIGAGIGAALHFLPERAKLVYSPLPTFTPHLVVSIVPVVSTLEKGIFVTLRF